MAAPLLCAGLALVVGAFYLWRINPQNQVRLRQIHLKNTALARTAGAPRLLVCGDSSVAFGMDPQVLRETTGLSTVNLGYDAGCGALALLAVGARDARAGDVLVVSINPGLLSEQVEPVREGRLLAMLYGDPSIALGGSPPLVPDNLLQRLLTRLSVCSPTQRRMVNDAGRVALRMPGYRYEVCEIDADGYFATKVTLPHNPAVAFPDFNARWQPVLAAYTRRLQTRGVRVFYALPWAECWPLALPPLRAGTDTYLQKVAEVMPVLHEADLGLKTDPALFSDTAAHLSVEGARQRSRALGEALQVELARPAPLFIAPGTPP